MNTNTPQVEIAASYFGFLDALGSRLRSGGEGEVGRAPLLDRLPGLQSLFLTFPAVSETERLVINRKVEDWNPIGQRLLLPAAAPVAASAFETDFSLLTMAAQSLIEWAHEAVHILAVEPWCAGHRDLVGEVDFIKWYLAAEALAFWYADIVVTRAIREVVPQAELVYSRSAISNSGFHPEEAFRRLGVTDSRETLHLYVNAFLGDDTQFQAVNDPLVAQYGRKLQEFYRGGRAGLHRLHGLFASFDLPGFWNRFCRRGDLPSLVSHTLSDDVASALLEIGTKVLPALSAMSEDRLEAVRVRRAVQIRAYHGWMLQYALRQSWVTSEDALDTISFLPPVEKYLDYMASALDSLIQGSIKDAADIITVADMTYDLSLRKPFQVAKAGLRYRYWVFPYFAPTGGIIGLWDVRTDYSTDEAEAVLRFVSEMCDWDRERITLLARALDALKMADRDKARACFNEYMNYPTVRSKWSIDLGALSPRDYRFREILFEFH